jgi:Tfp pilus assembly protein PilN
MNVQQVREYTAALLECLPELHRALPLQAHTMLLGTFTLLLTGASFWLAWKLVHARQQNTLLHREVARLRGRLRTAQQ